MPPPIPTPIFRLVHVDNLGILLRRGGLHAPNHTPNDGLAYRTIHSVDIQAERRVRTIPCNPRGTIHDYVSFYFGYLSPMLLQLKTERVSGYKEGQEPLICLVSSVQRVAEEGVPFVFSDGHGIAAFTSWYGDLTGLDKVDWGMVYQRYWHDTVDDMDRQRRKQAESMVYRFCPWTLIEQIAVVNSKAKARVESVLSRFDVSLHRDVTVRSGWYY